MPRSCARIAALLHRIDAQAGVAKTVRLGGFTLELRTNALLKEGALVMLSRNERALLKVLASHPGKTMCREHLAWLVQEREPQAKACGLEVLVCCLRKLIEPEPSQPRYIQQAWDMGYVFLPDLLH